MALYCTHMGVRGRCSELGAWLCLTCATRISGRLEDATGDQNEVAKNSYVRSVWLDTRDVRKPHDDR